MAGYTDDFYLLRQKINVQFLSFNISFEYQPYIIKCNCVAYYVRKKNVRQ